MLVGAFAEVPSGGSEISAVARVEPESAEDIDTVSEVVNDQHAAQAPPKSPRRPRLYAPVLERLVRFVLVISAVIVLGEVWALDLINLSESSTLAGRALSACIDMLVAYLIADLIWVWAKTAIDTRLADYTPPEPGHAPGPDARLATLAAADSQDLDGDLAVDGWSHRVVVAGDQCGAVVGGCRGARYRHWLWRADSGSRHRFRDSSFYSMMRFVWVSTSRWVR